MHEFTRTWVHAGTQYEAGDPAPFTGHTLAKLIERGAVVARKPPQKRQPRKRTPTKQER